ncbi:MAG: hypothetical protein KBT69_03720, partial [Oceanihabitans sp.]|nr:hypothetical protein [Oceanihabitans sp.]
GYIDYTGLKDGFDIFEEDSVLVQNMGDNIFEQAQLFEEALAYYENAQSTIEEILNNQQRTQSEVRFNELFNNKRWPVNIRI